MGISKDTKLIKDQKIWFVDLTYTQSVLPLSKLDNKPSNCYFIRPYTFRHLVNWPGLWITEQELFAQGFKIATKAEVVLYG